MADWITSDQYLDLVDRACQADKRYVYQLDRHGQLSRDIDLM